MPVKFGDLNKVAKSVLSDDYLKGYSASGALEFKAKQKVSATGSVFTTTVKYDMEGKGSPATLSIKHPKPLGVDSVTIDKLDVAKDGNVTTEISVSNVVDKLSLLVKGDFQKKEATGAVSFTGIADTLVRAEVLAHAPQKSVLEITRDQGPATLGIKATLAPDAISKPDVGLRCVVNGIFASLNLKKLQDVEVMSEYKINSNVDVALAVNRAGDGTVKAEVGSSIKIDDRTSVKVKGSNGGDVESLINFAPYQGFKVLAGVKYAKKDGATFGASLNIE